MLPDARIKEIALEVARASLAPQRVEDVLIEPASIWDGEDALWVMTILPSGDMSLVTGHKITRYMMQLQERLEQEGDYRRPYPRWATPEELAEDLIADDDYEP